MEQLGRYKIQTVLGRGAMGTVYRAHDPTIDRVVAIKTITIPNVTIEEQTEYRERFFREARAAGRLSHPGVVTVYDVGEQQDTHEPYLVMEFVEGNTLDHVISDSPTQPPSVALDLAKQIAEALDYAHSQGIVHRDIKPANIIVTTDGRTKITDFGVAKLSVTQLTVPGETLGTPAYMSPEQVSGGPVDGRSDLFSLGIVLYSMLAGQKPFGGENASSVMFKIAYQEPTSLTLLNPLLDPRLNQVISRALAKRPEDRYQSGKDFADDLQSLSQGRSLKTFGAPCLELGSEATVVSNRGSTPAPSAPKTSVENIQHGSSERMAHLPAKIRAALGKAWTSVSRGRTQRVRLSLGGIALFLALCVFGSMGPAKTVKLEIRCAHSFTAAELLVWIDDELAYEKTLEGSVRKRLGIIKTVQGSLLDAALVAPGKHLIRVQVVSKTSGYDQSKVIQADLSPESTTTLDIGFAGRNNSLEAVLR